MPGWEGVAGAGWAVGFQRSVTDITGPSGPWQWTGGWGRQGAWSQPWGGQAGCKRWGGGGGKGVGWGWGRVVCVWGGGGAKRAKVG